MIKLKPNLIDEDLYTEAIDLLKKLVSVNTVNPPGNEIQLKSIVKDAFASLGAEMEVWEKEKDRANFIGKIGKEKPTLGFFPHLDTVPAGDGWITDPFKPVIKDGKLYARGAIDSKGNFVSSWLAIKTFLKQHRKFNGTIYLVGCADEETGSSCGVKYLLEKGFKVDYAIVPDGGYMDKIIIGEKGVLRIRVKSYGKQAHGSSPDLGINAIENLIILLNKISAIEFHKYSYHKSFSGITKNLGVFKGGYAPNIVPAYAEAEIDIRIPLGIDKDIILDQIYKKEKEIVKQKGSQINIEEIFSAKPHLTNTDSTLVKSFLRAARDFGIGMRIGTMGGITDAKPLSLTGIETLVHSADDGSHSAHNANEYVKLENLKTAASLYALTLTNIFKV